MRQVKQEVALPIAIVRIDINNYPAKLEQKEINFDTLYIWISNIY